MNWTFPSCRRARSGQFTPRYDGGDWPLPYREAINWIDASSDRFQRFGCLAASNCTVHLFADSDRQSGGLSGAPARAALHAQEPMAWDPVYWFTQAGNHSFRMALYPHSGGWRERYRDGIAFNFPLLAFMASGKADGGSPCLASGEFLRLEPGNLIMTALKKSEDDDSLALRFYEAEGRFTRARVRLAHPFAGRG